MSRQDREPLLTCGCSEVVEFSDLRVLRTLEFFPRVPNVFDNSTNIRCLEDLRSDVNSILY
jgi:hypothetical protein